ncbi:MAG: glycosyltransferase family 4 protein [Phormidesmis sp.]
MAKFQIISTFSRESYAAYEALWHEFACRASQAGHTVEISLTSKAEKSNRTSLLRTAGCQLKFRKAWPNGRLGYVSQKLWDRSLAGGMLRATLNSDADLCLLNVGTLIEVTVEPFFSYLMGLNCQFSLIVHNNPEIRQYSSQTLVRLREVLFKATRVYFVSHRLWENCEEQLLQKVHGAEIVRNPVNLEDSGAEPWPEGDRLRLAIVGRWDTWVKGQIRAIHALSSFKWKQRNWSLSLFGAGSDTEQIQQAIKFYGVQDRIELAGFVDNIREDIWRSHHVLLMPSMLEGMPLTLVEAMLCGRPAVVSDVGGARELVNNGTNGFLADSPFFTQLEEALEKMWQSRARLSEIGARASEDAKEYVPSDAGEQFLKQVMVSLYEKPDNR